MNYGKIALLGLGCALAGAVIAWLDSLLPRRFLGPASIAGLLATIAYFQWLDPTGIALTIYGVRAAIMAVFVGAPGLIAIVGYIIGAAIFGSRANRRGRA